MNEAVAAQQQVSVRKRIVTEIDTAEGAVWPAELVTHALDQLRDDVTPNVARHRKFDLRHPMKIAARQVEERANLEVSDKAGQAFPNSLSVVQRRSAAGNGFPIAPDVASIDLAKDFAGRAS